MVLSVSMMFKVRLTSVCRITWTLLTTTRSCSAIIVFRLSAGDDMHLHIISL